MILTITVAKLNLSNQKRRSSGPAGVEWRVAGKIRVELQKSARVGWKVAAKNPGDLRGSAGDDGKLPERFAANFRDRLG